MNDLDVLEYFQNNGWIDEAKIEYKPNGSRILELFHKGEAMKRIELTITEKDYFLNTDITGHSDIQIVS